MSSKIDSRATFGRTNTIVVTPFDAIIGPLLALTGHWDLDIEAAMAWSRQAAHDLLHGEGTDEDAKLV